MVALLFRKHGVVFGGTRPSPDHDCLNVGRRFVVKETQIIRKTTKKNEKKSG